MKITVNQSLSITENEIIVNCSMVDKRLQQLIDHIRQYTFILQGTANEEIYQVPLESLLYIDSTDGKTFLYCSKKVYESKESLTSIEQQLLHTPFVRISKNCIMNTTHLRSVKTLVNHRLEATLINGEKLIISRNYIEPLKEKLKN
ncbi:MAG TPA: LytTR family DNA-binding domain-containing protein [Lachnospiraceae bacterium]|nr:LytTR family DNA-binding domain-containing protein [Lachnospiraceae bacterium]